MIRSFPRERLEGVNSSDGLASSEADRRRSVYGANEIIEEAPGGWRVLVRDTAKDPMIWFLFATSVLFAVISQWSETAILILAIAPLVGMDLYLHRRTQASTAGLRSSIAASASVMRDGVAVNLAASELVPGDLVLVKTGESFPADGVIIGGADIQADESTLTGESFPVHKQATQELPAACGENGLDTTHWGFAGTRLLMGEARQRIVYTGAETLYGGIVHSVVSDKHDRTPLQLEITNIVKILLAAAVVLCVILAGVRLQQGFGMVDALLSALTLAIAAIPEEFPLVFTFFLGVGVYRLAKRRALVRRAVVVENIGRITFICSDKTGTITEGRLHLSHVYPADGYSEDEVLRIAAFASRKDSGDPLDLAILGAGSRENVVAGRIATFPFTEQRRRETCVVGDGPGKLIAALKGAPETVLAACEMRDHDRERWKKKLDELASSAHKVIASATRSLSAADWPGDEPEGGFRFAGLLACEDPVRQGVPEAVRAATASGIHVIMVTGDHPATAAAVAREIGMGAGHPVVIEGDAFEDLVGASDIASLRKTDVIARAVPAQKYALVRALQSAGEIVAVTGDGVNDAPALQAADIGIAMGERGTRSACEVSAIVLLDDNFSTIVNAISEGRQLFRNLQMSFAYLLMVHIPLVISAALIPLAGHPLLYLPIHIVWLELIIHPTALLVFQELPPDTPLAWVRNKQVRPRFFGGSQWFIIACTGTAITVAVTLGYARSLGAGHDAEHARAMAMLVLIFAGLFITVILSRLRSRTARVTVVTSLMSAFVFIQTPWLSAFLHLAPLHFDDWLIAGVVGITVALPSVLLWRRPRTVHNAGRDQLKPCI